MQLTNLDAIAPTELPYALRRSQNRVALLEDELRRSKQSLHAADSLTVSLDGVFSVLSSSPRMLANGTFSLSLRQHTSLCDAPEATMVLHLALVRVKSAEPVAASLHAVCPHRGTEVTLRMDAGPASTSAPLQACLRLELFNGHREDVLATAWEKDSEWIYCRRHALPARVPVTPHCLAVRLNNATEAVRQPNALDLRDGCGASNARAGVGGREGAAAANHSSGTGWWELQGGETRGTAYRVG